jgi:TetR/AcrR family tetracycline transcriptional repressor
MSPERIVEVARRLVEAGGIESLSMRKLAAELGVAPTAIYWHIGGRDQLLHAILDQLVTDASALRARGDSPTQRVASIARAIRRQIRNTPVMFELAQHLDRYPDVSFPGQLAVAREISAAGLRGVEAAEAVRSVLFLVGGFQMVEGNFRSRPAGARTTQELWRKVDDPSIDPQLRDSLSEPADTDALFDYALEALLGSILP